MKRMKKCPVCRKRVGYQLDLSDGETKLETHNRTKITREVCPGSRQVVAQR